MLARLVAERGKLDEAIQLFEAAEKDKLLSAADFRMLADWYIASDRRAAYERSRIESFKQAPEHQLYNMLYQVRNRWMWPNQPLPSELDENTLFALRALFEKSASPENYLSQLRDLYAACRDFRLLEMLPDAVLGRSPQQAYSFLLNLDQVLSELRNEATADEIIARVRQLREADRTAIDLRALDLIEAVIERKSSEVLNQPGPHADACLAALERAFGHQWADGELVQMANFLSRLGALHHPKLLDEQLRELRELQKLASGAARDHLLITNNLSNLLFWSYGRKDDAIRQMEAEVRSFAQAHNGIWPHQDNDVLGSYVSLYEGTGRHSAGESVLQTYLAKPEHDEQRKWLSDRLMALYNHALEHNGAVSIGDSGAKLFQSIVALTLKELDAAPDENVRQNLVVRLMTTFDIANRHKIPGTADAVRKFAFDTMPTLLKRQQAQYRNTAMAPMQVIADALGPKVALQYVVERLEQYPERLEIQWDNAWNTFGYELALRREQAVQAKLDIRELEPRVLKLAIRELQRGLRTGESRSNYIYHRQSGHFWNEKAADFAQAAEVVLAERKSSGRRAMTVANYLWHGLGLQQRAIEILLLAHKNGLLEDSADVQLAQWLQEVGRYAEMIPILEPLVAARPDVINYRTQLMVAYYHSQRPEQLADLIQKTHELFHQAGRWTEGNVAQFARGCFACSQWDRATGYFNEAIALHQRGNPGHGQNDATLSELYRQLALAQSALGRTREAVDAASASIVCWSFNHDQRRNSFDSLKQVLVAAKDLDDYVHHHDQEAAETGQDSPILRKAIGQTYQSRNEHSKAIAQFQLALELQPNDKETHQALIASYDATGNSSAAVKQLIKLIDLNRHDLALYQQLAERLKNDEQEAERAATSIIESSPNEAESHAAMAELRQKQNRWDEAIPHWEQVAQLRRLEPNGLLKLTEAQLHQKQWDAARSSIEKLQKTEWPSRFSDVNNQSRLLQERLPK
jgi:Flp pilus assembly protein TadD